MIVIDLDMSSLVSWLLVIAFLELQVALFLGYKAMRQVFAWLNAVGVKLSSLEKRAAKVLPAEGESHGGGILGGLGALGQLFGLVGGGK